jgi:peptide/nickel transport system substrate-binding protein
MQRILYQDNPEIVLFYDNDLQAYRSDRWTGFVEQPEPQGYLLFGYGPYSYRSIEPASASQADGGQGGSAAVWVIGAGVILVGAVAAALLRRRSGAEERE